MHRLCAVKNNQLTLVSWWVQCGTQMPILKGHKLFFSMTQRARIDFRPMWSFSLKTETELKMNQIKCLVLRNLRKRCLISAIISSSCLPSVILLFLHLRMICFLLWHWSDKNPACRVIWQFQCIHVCISEFWENVSLNSFALSHNAVLNWKSV